MYRILIILLLLTACAHPKPQEPAKPITIYIHDTIYIPADTGRYITIINDLKDSLFVARYKIERVKYYVDIVDRKPSQIKYLKGWIKRAVSN